MSNEYELLNRYCYNHTIDINCMASFSMAIDPCLNPEEIANKNFFINALSNVVKNVCRNEKLYQSGVACAFSKRTELFKCYFDIYSNQITPKKTLDNLLHLDITKYCRYNLSIFL